MGIISSRLGYPKLKYKEPERLTADEARQRRFFAELSKQRKALEAEPARLSPANKFHLNRLKEFEVKFGAELDARRKRMDEVNRTNVSSYPKSLALKTARSRLFQLEQRRSALLQAAAAERRANVFKKSFFDRRMWSPYLMSPKTVFGTDAWIKHGNKSGQSSRRLFRNPLLSLPCVDRLTRREVMFAHRHAGRAYRKPHKFNPLSLIGC